MFFVVEVEREDHVVGKFSIKKDNVLRTQAAHVAVVSAEVSSSSSFLVLVLGATRYAGKWPLNSRQTTQSAQTAMTYGFEDEDEEELAITHGYSEARSRWSPSRGSPQAVASRHGTSGA